MLQTLLVYAHILATSVGIGAVVMIDLALLRHRHTALSSQLRSHIHLSARAIAMALVVLWVTGIAFVGLGSATDASYLHNPKLWAKISVVLALTLNGALIHVFVLPRLRIEVPFEQATTAQQRVWFHLLGAISTASWFLAAFFGVAKVLNHVAPYSSLMLLWLVSIISVYVGVNLCFRLLEYTGRTTPADIPRMTNLPGIVGAYSVTGARGRPTIITDRYARVAASPENRRDAPPAHVA